MFFTRPKHSFSIYGFYTISFILFSAYIIHAHIVYSTEISGFLLLSHDILLTHYLLKQIVMTNIRVDSSLRIKTLIVFNLTFANNTILSCFFLFLLIIGSLFLILALIVNIFIHTVELVIPTRAN